MLKFTPAPYEDGPMCLGMGGTNRKPNAKPVYLLGYFGGKCQKVFLTLKFFEITFPTEGLICKIPIKSHLLMHIRDLYHEGI